MLLDRVQAAGLLLPPRERPEPEPRFSRPLAAHVGDADGPVLLLHARERMCAGVDSAILATSRGETHAPEPELEIGRALRMVAEQVDLELQEAISARARRHTATVGDGSANGLPESTVESRVCSLISVLLEQLGVLREALLPHTESAEVAGAAAVAACAEQVRLSARCKELARERNDLLEQIAEKTTQLDEVIGSITNHATDMQPGSAELLPRLMQQRDSLEQDLHEHRAASAALEATLANEQLLFDSAAAESEVAKSNANMAWLTAHERVSEAWAQQLRHTLKFCSLDGVVRVRKEAVEIRCGSGRLLLPHRLATATAVVSGWAELTPLSISLPYHHGVTDAIRVALLSGGEKGVFATVGSSDSGRVAAVLAACGAIAIDSRVVEGSNHSAALRAADALMLEAGDFESSNIVGIGPREVVLRPWPLHSLLLVDDADHLPPSTIDRLIDAARARSALWSRRAGRHSLPCVLCLCWSDSSLADQPDSVRVALQRAVPVRSNWRVATHEVASANHRCGDIASSGASSSKAAHKSGSTAPGCQIYRSRRQLELLHGLALEGFSYYENLSHALDESLPSNLSPVRAPCRDLIQRAGLLLRAMDLPVVEGVKTGKAWAMLAELECQAVTDATRETVGMQDVLAAVLTVPALLRYTAVHTSANVNAHPAILHTLANVSVSSSSQRLLESNTSSSRYGNSSASGTSARVSRSLERLPPRSSDGPTSPIKNSGVLPPSPDRMVSAYWRYRVVHAKWRDMLTLEANGNFSQGQPGRRRKKPSHRSGRWVVQWKGRAPHWRGSILTLTWAGIRGLPGLPPETLKTTDGGQHWEGTQGYRFDCELIDGVLPLRVDDQTGLGFRQPYIEEAAGSLPHQQQRDADLEEQAETGQEEVLLRSDFSSTLKENLPEEHEDKTIPLTPAAQQISTPAEQKSRPSTNRPETPQQDEDGGDKPTQTTSPPAVAAEAKHPSDGLDNAFENISAEQNSMLATSSPDALEKDEPVHVLSRSPPKVLDQSETVPDRKDGSPEAIAEPRKDHDVDVAGSKGSSLDGDTATDEQALLEEAQRLLSERDADP